MSYELYINDCNLTIEPPLDAEQIEWVRSLSGRAKRNPPDDLPSCLQGRPCNWWTIGLTLEVDQDRSPERSTLEWLCYIIDKLKPTGRLFNGEVRWEDSEGAFGTFYVRDNQTEDVEDVRYNPGPSWAPNKDYFGLKKLCLENGELSAEC